MGRKNRNFNAPKRATKRIIWNFTFNGSTADQVLFTADEAITLTRVLVNGSILTEATSGAHQRLDMEFWRLKVGNAVPAMDVSANISYAQNQDLYSKHSWGLNKVTGDGDPVIPVAVELKGKRKMKEGDAIIAAFSGGSSMFIVATVVLFFLES